MNNLVTARELARICGIELNQNLNSIHEGLKAFGKQTDLCKPHKLAVYLTQTSHESGSFRWDREVWRNTAAQRSYEGRRNLGNDEPGDGKKFLGRTGIQITGRYNTESFTKWCKARWSNAPDFAENPDLMLTDPWEGLGPIWYWDSRKLSTHCDRPTFYDVISKTTLVINGGLNGFGDRIRRFGPIALRMLGYPNTRAGIRQFQKDYGFAESEIDGKMGPITRGRLFDQLRKSPKVRFDGANVIASNSGASRFFEWLNNLFNSMLGGKL